ncbi:hypothetical protein [Zavarzinia sp. CC-PAN008]|uniref:hypothetical protein n=1 Tax=Zavarzinia sp. CC-PAN008 TaxID=3243332 RepID=UPI003F748A2E
MVRVTGPEPAPELPPDPAPEPAADPAPIPLAQPPGLAAQREAANRRLAEIQTERATLVAQRRQARIDGRSDDSLRLWEAIAGLNSEEARLHQDLADLDALDADAAAQAQRDAHAALLARCRDLATQRETLAAELEPIARTFADKAVELVRLSRELAAMLPAEVLETRMPADSLAGPVRVEAAIRMAIRDAGCTWAAPDVPSHVRGPGILNRVREGNALLARFRA